MADVTSIWETASALRGFWTTEETAARLIALVAVRRILDTRGEALGAVSPLPEMTTFAELASSHDVHESIERVLRHLARGAKGSEAVTDSSSTLLDLARNEDRRALALAVHAVAGMPRDVVGGADGAAAVRQLVARSVGKSGDLSVAGANLLRLMSQLGELRAGARICDPSCGAGFLLLAAAESAGASGGATLHGSDPNRRTAALARIVLMLAGVHADIETANVLVSAPERQAGPYDAVLSMPPMGSHPPPHLHIEGSDRFRFGAPSRNADWLYAQHALSILAPDGVAVLLVARGPLFRAGSEADVRRGLIDADFVDAVVGLPPGMVSNTAIPTALLVLRRTRAPARRGKVLFVGVPSAARTEDRRADLPNDLVEVVARVVHDSTTSETPVRARAVTSEEIAAAEYSLLPSRYFEPLPSTERRTIQEIQRDLRAALANEATVHRQAGEALAALVAATVGGKVEPERTGVDCPDEIHPRQNDKRARTSFQGRHHALASGDPYSPHPRRVATRGAAPRYLDRRSTAEG